MKEIPGRNLAQIIPGRNRRIVGCGVGVHIFEREIRSDSAQRGGIVTAAIAPNRKKSYPYRGHEQQIPMSHELPPVQVPSANNTNRKPDSSGQAYLPARPSDTR